MRWPLLCVALLCGGCESLTYYAQSIRGQAEVVAATRPIPEVLGDPTTADGVRERLAEIPQVRAFAVAELGLVDSGSFEGYADLQREAMVWSLTAAPATSLVPREWCYPVIGCARYRGYFRRDAAERAAERLAIAGWDVAVEPAPAYSTLGWFDDPLPSTVIDWPLPTIVALLFHELAHETLYLRGDSTFNESYATLVEREGLRRWLASYGSPEQRREMARLAGLRQDFAALLDETRVELSALYAAPITRDEMLARKRAVFSDLRHRYLVRREAWGGYAGYDRWFERPLNNARIAAIDTYVAWLPAFERLLALLGDELPAFHAACREIAAWPPPRRAVYLQRLAEAS